MKKTKACRIERKYAEYEVLGIDSSAEDLVYFVDVDRTGIIVAGKKGMTLLSVQQAKAMAGEIAGIIDMMDLKSERRI